MSAKRPATTDLNHENWDKEDSNEEEEPGVFKMAPKEVLEKRVIKTAKRRSQVPKGASVFSGFSGFNKVEKSSFDFLANLTNGSQSNNQSTSPQSETPTVSSSSMITRPTSNPSSGIFSLSATSTPITKSVFSQPISESKTFVGLGSSPTFKQSIFGTSKPDSTVKDSPLKEQSPFSAVPNNTFTINSNANSDKPISQVSSTLFGIPSTNANNNNTLFTGTATFSGNNNTSPFSSKTNIQTPFKTSVTSSTPRSSEINKPASKSDSDDKKLIYYNNLRGLNESVSAWIKKHVEETPLCILTPIFRDYEKHLKNINDDYEKGKEESSNKSIADTKTGTDTEAKSTSVQTEQCLGSKVSTTLSSSFSNNTMPSKSLFSQSASKITTSLTEKTTSPFTFGINTSTTVPANNIPTTVVQTTVVPTTVVPSTGFSFGIKNPISTTSPFTISAKDSGNTPFSFGVGKPFAFNSNIKTKETVNDDDKEDEPPKVEYKPIAEDNSVYDRKCKIFVKKDGNFVDKGVGTLYIKKIEEGGKYQLLVRANTSLGNVLINMILSSSIPTQRMGKNNVMMVCMPTPDAKPPPTSILIRVKTSEDADELLETLNKYKTEVSK